MNSTISFIDKETLEESMLYESVKSIAPTIFPSIIKSDGVEEDVIDDLIKEVE